MAITLWENPTFIKIDLFPPKQPGINIYNWEMRDDFKFQLNSFSYIIVMQNDKLCGINRSFNAELNLNMRGSSIMHVDIKKYANNK